MLFFDFFYLKVFQLYKGTSDDSPEFAGVCAAAGFQAFNLITIRVIYAIFTTEKDLEISKVTAIVILFVLIVLHYFRYIQFEKNNYLKLGIKWNGLSVKKRNCIAIY